MNLRKKLLGASMDKSELIKLYLDASDEVKIFVVKILENSQPLPEPRE